MGTLDTNMVITENFGFYVVLFSVIMSTILAALVIMVVETPLIDFVKFTCFKNKWIIHYKSYLLL